MSHAFTVDIEKAPKLKDNINAMIKRLYTKIEEISSNVYKDYIQLDSKTGKGGDPELSTIEKFNEPLWGRLYTKEGGSAQMYTLVGTINNGSYIIKDQNADVKDILVSQVLTPR